jgi:mycothiol system anti-sigma-R factor
MKEHCKETLKRAYLFLDKEVLTEAERQEIRQHLEECYPCLERYDVEREVTLLIARLKGHIACPDKLRTRIESLIEEA